MGKVRADAVVHQGAQLRLVTAGCVDLEAAEAQEGRRHATDDGALLKTRVAVVEHVTPDALAAQHEA